MVLLNIPTKARRFGGGGAAAKYALRTFPQREEGGGVLLTIPTKARRLGEGVGGGGCYTKHLEHSHKGRRGVGWAWGMLLYKALRTLPPWEEGRGEGCCCINSRYITSVDGNCMCLSFPIYENLCGKNWCRSWYWMPYNGTSHCLTPSLAFSSISNSMYLP